MKILAIDPGATQAGFALYSPDHPDRERGIECNSFTSTGATQEIKAEQFGRHLEWVINHFRPDFICFELAMRKIGAYEKKPDLAGAKFWTPNADQMILPELQGHIRQAAISHVLPFDSVAVRSWRAKIFGKGGGDFTRDQAKAQAKLLCDRLKINYRNHNEAEASLLALWCATCSQIYRGRLLGMKV